MTGERMFELMHKGEELIADAVHEAGFYMDDQGWGDAGFRIGIYKDVKYRGRLTQKKVTAFWFHYDEFETYYGTDEEQLEEQAKEFLRELDDYMEQFEY